VIIAKYNKELKTMGKVEYWVAVCIFIAGWLIGAYGGNALAYLKSIDHSFTASMFTIVGSIITVLAIMVAYRQWCITRVDDLGSRLAQISFERQKNGQARQYYLDQGDAAIDGINKIRFNAEDKLLGHLGTLYVAKLVKFKNTTLTATIKTKWIYSQSLHDNQAINMEVEVVKIMTEVIELLRKLEKGPSD
jgi:hypothetical protein